MSADLSCSAPEIQQSRTPLKKNSKLKVSLCLCSDTQVLIQRNNVPGVMNRLLNLAHIKSAQLILIKFQKVLLCNHLFVQLQFLPSDAGLESES